MPTFSDEEADQVTSTRRGRVNLQQVDPEGDGVLVTRDATVTDQGKFEAQAVKLREWCAGRGLRPRYELRAVLPGRLSYEQRPDLQAVVELAAKPEVNWIVWADLDRIARESAIITSHLDAMAGSGVTVWLQAQDRRADEVWKTSLNGDEVEIIRLRWQSRQR